jgi:hypothetical protein
MLAKKLLWIIKKGFLLIQMGSLYIIIYTYNFLWKI